MIPWSLKPDLVVNPAHVLDVRWVERAGPLRNLKVVVVRLTDGTEVEMQRWDWPTDEWFPTEEQEDEIADISDDDEQNARWEEMEGDALAIVAAKRVDVDVEVRALIAELGRKWGDALIRGAS